jgi:hypothetical protein
MSTKAVKTIVRLLVPAGQAKPAPPVGPALGQAGLNIMSFCKDFNARTADIKVLRWRVEFACFAVISVCPYVKYILSAEFLALGLLDGALRWPQACTDNLVSPCSPASRCPSG